MNKRESFLSGSKCRKVPRQKKKNETAEYKMERTMTRQAPLHDITHEHNVRSRTNNNEAIYMRRALDSV